MREDEAWNLHRSDRLGIPPDRTYKITRLVDEETAPFTGAAVAVAQKFYLVSSPPPDSANHFFNVEASHRCGLTDATYGLGRRKL
jgi:hypothetical protein